MNRAPQILGLDIGGANLKAAHTNGAARTVPFPLWKHPERLPAALHELCAQMPAWDQVALTMTGELCDCFATKSEGVHAILRSVAHLTPPESIRVWGTQGYFLTFAAALEDACNVAAANWLALAHFVADRFADRRLLLIDTGSTTTDIVYLNRTVPEPRAFMDAGRLNTGELVYTGLRRTPICAVLGAIRDGLAAEFFATMMDAYVVLDLVPENRDDCDTADGRPLTRAASHARLARMRCADDASFTEAQARQLAEEAVREQQDGLLYACGRVMAGRAEIDGVVVSGSGEIIARGVAALMGKPVTSLSETLGPSISDAACAYAVAVLAAREAR